MVIAVNCIVKWYQFDKLKIILIDLLMYKEKHFYVDGIIII